MHTSSHTEVSLVADLLLDAAWLVVSLYLSPARVLMAARGCSLAPGHVYLCIGPLEPPVGSGDPKLGSAAPHRGPRVTPVIPG